MDENKKEDLLFGGALRLGYEILKKNVKNPKYDSVFEFFESVGKEFKNKRLKYVNLVFGV